MDNIALPQKIDYQTTSKTEGKIIVEPLFPGFGITLGNSIRRVLLSSLPGAAPVGVKIKGVDHEFMTLPHLKEDILEFILNLKQLKLKVHSAEAVVLELKVHGEKQIKAADISKSSAVEIVNLDLVLGSITDMSGSLEAEIFVSQGMGYEMIENREKRSQAIGYIEMDSIFSPVLSTGINVENVRVGKMTNWDKLIVDIVTDGTISAEEAFKQAVNILIKQFDALIGLNENKEEEGEETEKVKVEEAEEMDKASQDEAEKNVDSEVEEPKKKRGRPKKLES